MPMVFREGNVVNRMSMMPVSAESMKNTRRNIFQIIFDFLDEILFVFTANFVTASPPITMKNVSASFTRPSFSCRAMNLPDADCVSEDVFPPSVSNGSGCEWSQIPSPLVSMYRGHSPGYGSSSMPKGQSSHAEATCASAGSIRLSNMPVVASTSIRFIPIIVITDG